MVQGRHFIKSIFISILLITYLYLMAKPSIEKYVKGGIITEETTPNTSYYPPYPAVTFCPAHHNARFTHICLNSVSALSSKIVKATISLSVLL